MSRLPSPRWGAGLVIAALAIAASTAPAHAYEFWLRTQAIGQAFQLRQYRLVGPDLFQGRRRYTQTLALRITDIGDLRADRRRQRRPGAGPTVSWHSYLRIDHDYGSFASGRIALSPAVRRDAVDVVPELAEAVAGLDLLYGYVAVEGLAGDRVALRLGRVLADEGWGTYGVDGAAAQVTLPGPVALSATAGLRVRASSPLGMSSLELDGTSGAGCREYVEGQAPGTGAWRLIDRDRRITGTRLASDLELCPQRDVAQPTIGVALTTLRDRRGGVEIGYRRTWSETVGVIGAVDRFTYPDRGLYPDELGQAPASGVNEERLYARAHGRVRAGGVTIEPYANARLSLLHAAVDRADAGVRLRRGDHVLEPTVDYFLPTFDGDSIFNVFSIEPTTDARLGYEHLGRLRTRVAGWLRRYAHTDDTASLAGGLEVGVEHPLGAGWRARVDGLWDDGFGGRRIGGSGELAWRPRRTVWVRGRAIVLGVDRDDAQRPAYVTTSAVASTSVQIADAVAVHLVGEADHDAIGALQLRMFAIIDLAFMPEQ